MSRHIQKYSSRRDQRFFDGQADQRIEDEVAHQLANPIALAAEKLYIRYVYRELCRVRGKNHASARNYDELSLARSLTGYTSQENGSYLYVKMTRELEGLQLPKDILGFEIRKRHLSL